MLSGLSSRWKQIAAFNYTGNSTKRQVYKTIILEIIHKAAAIGLHVVCVTSDMGSVNRRMWYSFGICATRNKIVHPEQSNKWLYFLVDPPHLIKIKVCIYLWSRFPVIRGDECLAASPF